MFKIAFCAGHHLGNPKGVPKSMGLGDIREWTLNDQVAQHFARAALEYEGVSILRTDDSTGQKFIDIPERTDAANKWGADIYIDMHHNGGINGGTGGGVVAFSYPGSVKGKEYRDAIYAAVIAAGGLRGNRSSPLIEKAYDSLRYSNMPAVIMEYGFMDSKTDAPIIIKDEYSKLVAYATMEGIAKVAGLKKRKQEKAPEAEAPQKEPVQEAPAAPSESTCTVTLPVLKNGSKGESVRAMQQLLIANGYSCGSSGADGIFGTMTGSYLAEYQKDHGLTADKICGTKTWAKLLGV